MSRRRAAVRFDAVAVGERLRAEGERFAAAHAAEVAAYRQEISDGVRGALDELRATVAEVSGGNPLAGEVARQAADYVDWLQWTLWDLPYFAVALRPERERFRRAVASCALVYLAIRVLDDVLDRHFWYRGHRLSLLATLTRSQGRGRRSEGLVTLAALLLALEGIARLAGEAAEPAGRAALERVLAAARRVLVGLLMEESEREAWTPAFYDRLVELKNVEYSRILYAALDPGERSPLAGFLGRYYALAQKLNDLQDYAADEARGQPNLLAVHRPPQAAARPARRNGGRGRDPVEALLAAELAGLVAEAEALAPVERGVACLKLAESLAEAVRLGLFQPAAAAAGGAGANGDGAAPEPLRLAWYSTLSEIVERAGPGALEEAACPVCGGDGRKRLLEKQGFTLVRCLDCFHAYVNPRLAGAVRARLGAELDGHGEDVFLEVQRIYAEPLCRRFLAAAAGRRLLDVGFGRGHLLHAARAYGFEVFGVDGSPALVEAQRPYLGERVVCQTVGEEPLPWGAFDVVVLSHVLEHLPRPQSLLGRVREALNPEGLLYVAVPDLGSVQFRVLGRRWNVVNPLVHFQYFNQASLERLLADAGMEVVERVEHPALNEAVAPRWMRLFRRLGGSESGELALLARVRP